MTTTTLVENPITLWNVPHTTGNISTVWSVTRIGAMKKAADRNGHRWGKPGIPTKA